MPDSILRRIEASVRERLPDRRRRRPLATLEAQPLFSRLPLDLAEALCGGSPSVIAEIKLASPSAGVIKADADVAAIARAYQEAGAAALSIVTEPDHFGGDIGFLELAREQSRLPLLRKDFIVDPYQIVEARASGADAVLLIAALLERRHLAELMDAAEEHGLSALVEVYDEHEFERIDLDRIRILGVNNRDLATFKVDVTRAGRLLSGVPSTIVRVAESGLRTAADLKLVHDQGIDAVLVGEALMREERPGEALRRLRGENEA